MAVKKILSTDTLETGFRAKYNETIDEIITGYSFPATPPNAANGYTLRLLKSGGGFIDINLQQFYYTKTQITQLLSGFINNPYMGEWDADRAAAGDFIANSVVDYNGSFWRANIDTTEVDIPGTNGNWTDILKKDEYYLDIPVTSASPYSPTPNYDGRYGSNPTVYAQQLLGDRVRNANSILIDILTTGEIIAYGDFSEDHYQIVIKP